MKHLRGKAHSFGMTVYGGLAFFLVPAMWAQAADLVRVAGADAWAGVVTVIVLVVLVLLGVKPKKTRRME